MGNKRNGLLALLGLGALAFWKYKNSTPEQQQAVKDKINNAKNNLTRYGNELKDKANNMASQAQEKAGEFAKKTESKVEDATKEAKQSFN